MKKLIFALCTSLAFTGMSISGAMSFSSPPQQPQSSVNQFIVHASSGCVVNWVNGDCGSQIDESAGGHLPVSSPPAPPVVDDGCAGLTISDCKD